MRTPEITILLCGGLGNQLFQYAYGRALALRSSGKLILDKRNLFAKDKKYKRAYELDAFRIPDVPESKRTWPYSTSELNMRHSWLSSAYSPLRDVLLEGKSRTFDPHLLEPVSRNTVVHGFWQSEHYFRDYADTIRKDLTFQKPVCVERRELVSKLEQEESVCVHARRVQYDRAVGWDYYEKAITRILDDVPDAKLYVFTDDPQWWCQNCEFKLNAEIIHDPKLPAIEDFKTMTRCRHFIIANSSYSWWAAWLAQHKGKQVIAPAGRFWSNPDTVPDPWMTI